MGQYRDDAADGSRFLTGGGPDAPRPISSDWLALRRPADEAARQASLSLIVDLQTFLGSPIPAATPGKAAGNVAVRVFDLGAGTGANQAWLAPQLSASRQHLVQHWTLIDHDRNLLEHTVSAPAINGVAGTRTVVAGIEDLGSILQTDLRSGQEIAAQYGPIPQRFVTCSALLDLLTGDQLRELCATLVSTGTAALFSLSVTGVISIEPTDPLDGAVNDAFNKHQQRGGRAGPRGVDLTAQYLADAGFTVTTVETPWRLSSDHRELIDRFLADRAESVVEEVPPLARDVSHWLARRSQQAAEGSLCLTIGHRDLLALPPRQ